jgi:hypothetical protein
VRSSAEGIAAGHSQKAQSVAKESARAGLEKDAALVIAMSACPSCGGRSSGAVARWWLRKSVPALFFVVGFLIAGLWPRLVGLPNEGRGALQVRLTLLVAAFAVVAGYAALRIWPRWVELRADRRDDRARLALASFQEHVGDCSECDMSRGRGGLCAEGAKLYRQKEEAEVPA